MGTTARIPDMTIGQLMSEATARWGETGTHTPPNDDPALAPERAEMTTHGDMTEHGQPVMAVFMARAVPTSSPNSLTRESLLFHPSTSPRPIWVLMQQPINNEGYEVHFPSSTPFSVGLPS